MQGLVWVFFASKSYVPINKFTSKSVGKQYIFDSWNCAQFQRLTHGKDSVGWTIAHIKPIFITLSNPRWKCDSEHSFKTNICLSHMHNKLKHICYWPKKTQYHDTKMINWNKDHLHIMFWILSKNLNKSRFLRQSVQITLLQNQARRSLIAS